MFDRDVVLKIHICAMKSIGFSVRLCRDERGNHWSFLWGQTISGKSVTFDVEASDDLFFFVLGGLDFGGR